MLDQGYDLSEIFDDERLKALAAALGISDDHALSELTEGLNSRYPDSSHDDTLASANAIRDLLDEGWLTPENLDSEDEGGEGVDSNGNDLDDEDDDDDYEDDDYDYEDDDGYGDYEDYDDDDEDFDDDFDEEEDEDDSSSTPSDKNVKDKKSDKGCVSDETMKNIIGALADI